MAEVADNRKIAQTKMEAICSRREYCSADIREKLKRYLLSEEVVEEILSSLQRDKYLDDSRYAAAFARDKASLSGWGAKKIEYALRRKGVASEVIKGAIWDMDREKVSERMQEVVLRKWNSLSKEKDSEKRCVKTIKFALGRGYSYDEVSSFVQGLKNSKV
ncbi:MAG: RecX family transcriptional regulator [Bacteroidales bacterium]|nr:RecX family transcriptional regulator [Bacteroidales bacterium]